MLIEKELSAWSEEKSIDLPRIITDRADRSIYSAMAGGKGPWDQMRIKINGSVMDMADSSIIVKNTESYKIFRAYIDQSDTIAKNHIDACINKYVTGNANG